MNRAAAALGLLPGETTLAVTVTAVMLLTSTGAAMGGAATDALFFAHFDVAQLPLMYVALGAVTLAFTLAVSALLARPDRARLYAAIPLALGLVLVLERVLVATGAPWVFPAIWLAMNVVATLQGIVTWGVASSLTDTRQAKRLFPLFNAGRIGGSIVGGFGTTALAGVLHAENLIPIWAASLVAAFALIVALFRARRPVSDEFVTEAGGILEEIGKGFAVVRRSPLLGLLSLASVLFSVLYFALALPFTREIRATFADGDALAAFLGLFNGVTTAAALGASLFLANRIYARVGVVNAIVAFTGIYLVGFAVLAAVPGLATVIAFRFVQLVWLTGIADTAYQALFNPVPPERRDQTRAFMEGVPGQAGIALAGILLLAGDRALEPQQISLIGLGVALVALVLVLRTRGAYRRALADALRAGRPQPFLVERDPLGVVARDTAAVATALAGLADADAGVRRVSAEVLEQVARPEHRDALVAGLRDEDGVVRVSALRALGRIAPGARLDMAEVFRGDPSASMRAAAAAALRDREALSAMLVAGSEDERDAALAELARDEALADLARPLLAEPSPRIRRAALALVAPRDALVARAALDDEDEAVRAVALAALSSSGRPEARAALRSLAERERDEVLGDLPYAAARPADERARLVADALRHRARGHGRRAIAAALALTGRMPDELVLEALERDDAARRASALELVETATDPGITRPLLPLWEGGASVDARDTAQLLDRARNDPDPFIRELATDEMIGGTTMQTLDTLSPLEKILFLRKVALFATLPPAELKQVAQITSEQLYADGATVVREGDRGDRLLIIVSGALRVLSGAKEIARRGPGEYVGEIALVTGEPRTASLVASGDTRCLAIGRREFDAILRDRPQVALDVIRVLALRLREATVRAA